MYFLDKLFWWFDLEIIWRNWLDKWNCLHYCFANLLEWVSVAILSPRINTMLIRIFREVSQGILANAFISITRIKIILCICGKLNILVHSFAAEILQMWLISIFFVFTVSQDYSYKKAWDPTFVTATPRLLCIFSDL